MLTDRSTRPRREIRTRDRSLEALGATTTITAGAHDTDGEFTVLDVCCPPDFEDGRYTHEPAAVFHVGPSDF